MFKMTTGCLGHKLWPIKFTINSLRRLSTADYFFSKPSDNMEDRKRRILLRVFFCQAFLMRVLGSDVILFRRSISIVLGRGTIVELNYFSKITDSENILRLLHLASQTQLRNLSSRTILNFPIALLD